MREKYIPAFIMLIAGLITSIINIVNKVNMLDSLIRLFLVLIIFYIVGLFTKAVIHKALKSNPKVEEDSKEENTEENKDGIKPSEGEKK